jgi:mutator protein MutT
MLGVGAIVLRRNSVLLVERGKEPHKGLWSLPGGVVETGERLEDALRREVLEETGLSVKAVCVVEVFERIQRDSQGRAEYHFVLVDYLCRPVSGELRPADDASRVAWVPRHGLSKFQITPGTVPVIEKAFEMRAAVNAHR